MGAASKVEQQEHKRDFCWATTGEPHALRRKAILAKYGDQVRALYGTDWRTGVEVIIVTLLQVAMTVAVRNCSWPKVLLLAYIVGGTLTQNLFTAQHELSHFLAFKKPLHNRLLSWASNCPLGVPIATSFRKYHQEHHSHLGVESWDVDLPTYAESDTITTTTLKSIWTFFYICIYGLRPLIIRPKRAGPADIALAALVIGYDAAMCYFLGPKALAYLLASSILGGGIHPMAGHLMAEHYTFLKGQETYSYYGPLNLLTYNVGYHNEHHDFPQIPQTRLYRLQEIAPEFYKSLGHHTSWWWITWTFMTDDEIGPWSRIKRTTLSGTPASAGKPLNGAKPAAAGRAAGVAPLAVHADASAVDKENVPPVLAAAAKAC